MLFCSEFFSTKMRCAVINCLGKIQIEIDEKRLEKDISRLSDEYLVTDYFDNIILTKKDIKDDDAVPPLFPFP